MKRLAIIAFSLTLLLTGLNSLAQEAKPSAVELDNQVFEIAKELRCPVCVSESVADSASEVSNNMRDKIKSLLEEGKSKEEILTYFQERYNDWILLSPPKKGVHLIVWILPLIAAFLGVIVLVFLVKRWTSKNREEPELEQSDLELIQKALEEQA